MSVFDPNLTYNPTGILPGASWDSAWIDLQGYTSFHFLGYSNVASQIIIHFSMDKVNVDYTAGFSVAAGVPQKGTYIPQARYAFLRFTNNDAGNGYLRLQVSLNSKPLSAAALKQLGAGIQVLNENQLGIRSLKSSDASVTISNTADEIDITTAGGGSNWELSGSTILTQKTPATVNNFIWQTNNGVTPNKIIQHPGGSSNNAILGGSEHVIQEANDSNSIVGGYASYIANWSTVNGAVCSSNTVVGSTSAITTSGTNASCLYNTIIGDEASFIDVAGTGTIVRRSTLVGASNSGILTTGPSTATLQNCSIFGGCYVYIQSTGATAPIYCNIYGGFDNIIENNCQNSHMLGGRGFTISNLSGCVMVGDNNNNLLTASVANEYTSRFSGGYRVYSNATSTTGMTMAAGGSSWVAVCDVNKKDIHGEVDYKSYLDRLEKIPIYEYNYKGNPREQRCVGPTAQDYHQYFGCEEGEVEICESKYVGNKVEEVKEEGRVRKVRTPLYEDVKRKVKQCVKDPLGIEQQDLIGVCLASIKALSNENKLLKIRLENMEEVLREKGMM